MYADHTLELYAQSVYNIVAMRVLIFSTAYLPLIGGAELAVKEITDRLPDIQFVMIAARLRSDLPTRERIGNVDV
ncbi:MAG: hypothetical protein AAB932_03820, partial [Patescibacteria group bacterium]